MTAIGAGRTDAGVHAIGQVASFALERDVDAETLVRALNFHLPPAVRALAAAPVDAAFHARYDARWKTYRYHIWTDGPMPPMLRAFAWHVPGALDVPAMDLAARSLEGRHDFAAFQSAGTAVPDTVREILESRARVVPADGDGPLRGLVPAAGRLIAYEVTGTGFLRHMVRAIAGTLVEIGQGRQPVEWMQAIVASGDRARAGRTAPADGLLLVAVGY